MKTTTKDFQRYNELRRCCTAMIRAGKKDYQIFNDAWTEMEEIKNRHGGLPPVPTDIDAAEMEMCELANEQGLR